MNSRDNDKWIEHLKTEPSDYLDKRINALVASLPMVSRKRGLRNRTVQLALAAIMLLLAVVFVPLFNQDRGRAWAKALANAQTLSDYSYHYTRTEFSPGSEENTTTRVLTGTYYVSGRYGSYNKTFINGRLDDELYCLRNTNQWVQVFPRTKEYLSRPLVARALEQRPKEMAVWLLSGRYTELGEKTVDDRVLAGLENLQTHRIKEDTVQYRTEAWFDTETMLPASITYSVELKNRGMTVRTVQDQYHYDIEFPADLFEPNIADDYEPSVVRGLRLFREMTSKYPGYLDYGVVLDTIGDRAAVEEAIASHGLSTGLYEYETLVRAEEAYGTMRHAAREYGYFGSRVRADDSNQVLLYWRWKGPRQSYHVVWGDLHMETCDKDEFVERARVVGDWRVLIYLLEKDDGDMDAVIAECIGRIGDIAAIPSLMKEADQYKGLADENPFVKAIETIYRHHEQQHPSHSLIFGRVVYANGKQAASAMLRIGKRNCFATRDGYFAMSCPNEESDHRYIGHAFKGEHQMGLFFLKKTDQPNRLTVVLDWPATVAGCVVNQDGQPCLGVEVGLLLLTDGTGRNSWPLLHTKTDGNGRYLFKKVPSGFPLELVAGDLSDLDNAVHVSIGELKPDSNYDAGRIVFDRVLP